MLLHGLKDSAIQRFLICYYSVYLLGLEPVVPGLVCDACDLGITLKVDGGVLDAVTIESSSVCALKGLYTVTQTSMVS